MPPQNQKSGVPLLALLARQVPAWCIECRQYISDTRRSPLFSLCVTCYRNLPFIQGDSCLKCGRNHHQQPCSEEWARAISDFHAVFKYEDPIHKWISSLKYSRNLLMGRTLQATVTHWFEENRGMLDNVDLLVPVPVHARRLWMRGFNQTSLLLNQQTVLKPNGSIVRKTRHTAHQAGMSRSERTRNMAGVFEIRGDVQGKRVLVFDDVCTTGKTLSEISLALKREGATRVDALVLCRTLSATMG